MTSSRLHKIIKINVISAIAFVFVYIILIALKMWTTQLYVVANLITIPYIVFGIISYYNIKFFPVIPFLLNIILIGLLCLGNGTIKLTVFLIVPVLIAMYYGSKKLNTIIIIFNILIYFLYPLYHSFKLNNPMPQLIIYPFAATIPYAFEVIFVVAISQRFMIDAEQIKKENELYASQAFNSSNFTVETYKTIIKARNYFFAKHIENVAAYTEIILNEMEKDPEYKDIITADYKRYVINGAVLHDIGKIDLPDSLLNKFGDLTNEELELIRQIPVRGNKIFQSFHEGSFNNDEKEVIQNIITQHQELLNGTGYPKHLFNRQISLEAQIVAVADYVDSGLMLLDGYTPKDFNSVYMGLITKGYEAYNQKIVNMLYGHRLEIIEYSQNCNEEIKQYMSKL